MGSSIAEHMPLITPNDCPKLNMLVTPCPGIAETCSTITLIFSFLNLFFISIISL